MKFRFDIDYEVEEDGIIYRAVRNDEDAAKTRDFYLDIFLKNEPATKSCGGYAQRHPGMVKQIDEYIADGVSIIAVDPNRDGFVVGIRTGFVVDKEEAENASPETLEDMEKEFPQPHANIMYLFSQCLPESVVFGEYPDCNRIYEMFALGTHHDYQRRGIAGKLVRHSWNVARKAECDLVMVFATSEYSAKIFRKLGMTKLREFKWTEEKIGDEARFSNVEFDMAEGYVMKL